jgi:hypothetical protein
MTMALGDPDSEANTLNNLGALCRGGSYVVAN